MERYYWSSYREYLEVPIDTDIDCALNILSPKENKAKEFFLRFMSEKSDDQCLEYNKGIKISDEEVIASIKKLGVANISELQRLEKGKRNEIIREIKRIEGTSIRQLERVMGIPKSIIHRT